MSRKIPDSEYEKTLSFRLKRWLDGTKDAFVNTVEMEEQKEFHEDDTTVINREIERQQRLYRLYDLADNWGISGFEKLYRIFCVCFCIFLVVMLLIAVSYLT